MDRFTIGKLARLAGVNIQTIRYYERAGLLHPISKTGAGYRLYGEGELKRLRFVRHAKELGFTLKEIKELMDLRVESPSACAEVLKKTQEKLRD
ncbi:MAG: MerR family transcriptional regulator, partial [Nitrospirae bacterium]|nr:MerR family transcriptional regulator [Nitrospirota bacterium]